MKVALGSDHAGYDAKGALSAALTAWGHEPVDLGCDGPDSVDYPDFGRAVAEAVARGEAACGVLVCGTGIGMSMAANKVAGVRAAVCHNEYTAELTRRHNDANVLCMGARLMAVAAMERCLDVFLKTDFEGGKHARRVGKFEPT
jgi:ribose 5-phosphate isomerase B